MTPESKYSDTRSRLYNHNSNMNINVFILACSDDSRSDDPSGPPHGSLHKHNSYPSNHPHSRYGGYNSYSDSFYRRSNYNNYNSYGDRGYNRPYNSGGRGFHNVYAPPMYMGPVIYLSPYHYIAHHFFFVIIEEDICSILGMIITAQYLFFILYLLMQVRVLTLHFNSKECSISHRWTDLMALQWQATVSTPVDHIASTT